MIVLCYILNVAAVHTARYKAPRTWYDSREATVYFDFLQQYLAFATVHHITFYVAHVLRLEISNVLPYE